MREAIDEAVSAFAALSRIFENKYGITFSSWNKRLFVIAIFLSIQDYAIRKELGPKEVEETLFLGFIVKAEEKRIIIDAYNGGGEKEELDDFFLKMLLVWEAEFVPPDKREQFLYIMFFYPFLAVLETVRSPNDEYKDIYKEYMAQEMEKDWDGKKIKWTKNSCEEVLRNFWAAYSYGFDAVKQQKIFELLDKGYTLRSVEFIEKSSEAEKVVRE